MHLFVCTANETYGKQTIWRAQVKKINATSGGGAIVFMICHFCKEKIQFRYFSPILNNYVGNAHSFLSFEFADWLLGLPALT